MGNWLWVHVVILWAIVLDLRAIYINLWAIERFTRSCESFMGYL